MLICLILAFIATALATLTLIRFYALKLNQGHTTTAKCMNGTSPIKVQTRSGSFSLLGKLFNPMCSEPVAQVSLSSKDSSVEIRQVFCKDIEVLPFQAGPINFSDVLFANKPKSVFDENYSPLTYFMDGSIRVILTSVTTNLSSTVVEVCYFTNSNDYTRFLIAGANWRNYTTDADCNSTVITVDNNQSYEVSFNISKPSFVFLGIASTSAVHIDQIEVSALGHNISSFGAGSVKACKLNGDNMKCNFSLLSFDHESQDICIVAYEDSNSDGSYDYSNLTLTLPTPTEMSRKQYEIFGFSSLGVGALTLVLLSATVVVILKWIQSPWPCTQTRSRNETSRPISASHVQSLVTTYDPTINAQENTSTGTETAPVTQVDTTAGNLVVTPSNTKADFDKTSYPANNTISASCLRPPIQETEINNSLSKPSSPVVRSTVPIQERTPSLSPSMDDCNNSSEINSDSQKFGEAVSETTLQPPQQ